MDNAHDVIREVEENGCRVVSRLEALSGPRRRERDGLLLRRLLEILEGDGTDTLPPVDWNKQSPEDGT